MKKVFLLLFACTVQGCALSPSSKQVEAVGKASSGAITVLAEPKALSDTVRLETAILRNSCLYLKGAGHYRLGVSTPAQTLALIDEQAEFAQSLKKYVEALAAVTDPAGIKKLYDAADQLAATFQQTASSAAAAAPAAVAAGPVAKIFLRAIVSATEFRRRYEIRKVVKEVQTILNEDARVLIGTHLFTIEQELDRQLKLWDDSANCNLRYMRHHQDGAYNNYRKFDAEMRIYIKRMNLIVNTLQAYQKFLDAHEALLNKNIDFDLAVAQLQEIIDGIQGIGLKI